DRLHLDQVDHADEAVLGADGQLNGNRVAPQPRADLIHAAQEIRAGAVHFVDESHARNSVLVHLAPNGFGLRLHTRHRAINRHSRVQHTQGALYFNGEVDVSGGVDDVDAVLGKALVHSLPEAGRRRGGDGDAALLLLFDVVHDGRSVMHFADLVRHARIKKNTLRRGGFPRVDVSGNTDISVSLNGRSACHIIPRLFMRFAQLTMRFAQLTMRFAQLSTGPMRP